ncbi:heme exporter protein CcmD [Labrys sp. La1]|uniref:heme exporter protein CcmD n=1 Tax=Labrys sp. La1 TaxID=3404917 RepID=UPI003EB87908
MVVFGMDLGPHWAFIAWAYGLAAIVIVALIAWVMLDHKAQHKTLAELESQGLRRRSRRDANQSGQTP